MKKQFVLGQDLQNSVDYLIVLFQCPNKDQNVVQIYYHDIFYYEVSKNIIYHSLESSGLFFMPKNITKDLKRL